ncbi:nitroreductase family protein [Rhizobium sp. TRM95111]|nr:nitroreductase family protein [Rhizobium alarense]
MSRRAILAGGAGALAAGAGIGVAASLLSTSRATTVYGRYAGDLRRPLVPLPDVRDLVRYATLAPNGHNSQPWLFRISARGIGIEPDFSRRTPVVDPDDHHLYVSLGCALENLALAAAAGGRRGEVEIAGTGAGGAAFVFSGGTASATDALRDQLCSAIPARQSTRGLYDGRAVAAGDLQALHRAAAVAGVDLAVITTRDAIDRARDLVIAGNTAQMADRAFCRELEDWIRFSPGRAMARGDGLYAPASGNPVLPEWLGSIAFALAFTASAENDKYARQMDSSAGLAVFAAATDGPAGWIAVGRACQRFCLMATVLGLKTAFVNQPVEVAAFRSELSALAGFAGRRPDLLLRFGAGPALPFSPRRPVESVIVA